MTRRTSPWPPGVPCWVDLGTPDVAGAQRLYGATMGWSFAEGGEEYGGYLLCERDGAPAAGIGPAQDGAPPAWTLYLASDDADATAAAVAANGGQLLAPPFDVTDLGRMFVALDPQGAVFGVWQAKAHIGAGIVNEPGALVWEDLQVPDPDAARAFYAAVFGYRYQPLEEAGPGLSMFSGPDGLPYGGMGGLGPQGVPRWKVYFAVGDADEAVSAATAAGATVVEPTRDSPYGRQAALSDPVGAYFAVIGTTGQDPDSADQGEAPGEMS